MRIVYLLATEKGWGGLEKHAFDVAGAMAFKGHDVVVLCSNFYQNYCPEGVAICPFSWKGSRRNPFLWLRLKRKIQELAPDVVHAQADKPAYILSRISWPQKSLAVGTVHNIKSGYAAYTKLDALIAVSGMIANQLNHEDVTVIHNGVVTSEVDCSVRAELKSWLKNKSSPIVLAIGRLVMAKGFDLLLQAWPKNTLGTLVILGDGKNRSDLEKIIADRQLENAFLLGESSHVREWISLADLLVISSRNEGGPYVLSEALINELAVIGTEVGMVPDFLPKESLVPPDDAELLRSLLASALSDPDHFKAISKPAIAKAKSSLSMEAMMSAVETLYLDKLKH